MFNDCLDNYDLSKLNETDNEYNYSFVYNIQIILL